MSTTPTPVPTGGSNFDQIGAALADPGPSQAGSEATTGTTDETVVDTPVEAEPTTPTTPAETEVSAQPADESTETPKAEVNPYEVDEGEDVTPQTLNTLLQTDRGRQIYQSFKTLREFSKPIDQGGIGHVPSVEQIRDYYSTYTDRVMMDHDLASSNPDKATRLVNFLFDSQRGQGVQTVAQQLAPALAKLNPETYAAAAQPFIQNYAGALFERYQQAKESGDDKLRSALWYAANVANYDMTGQWLKDGAAPANGANGANGLAPNGQPDPLAQRRAELDQRQADLDRRQQEAQSSQAQNWERATNQKIHTAISAEIDKALAPLKSSLTPHKYQLEARDFHQRVTSNPGRDPHAYKLYQVKVDQARTDPNVDLGVEFVKLIAPAIKAERKTFLEEAGIGAKQASDARHAELRQIDSQKTLSNGSGSQNPAIAAPLKRLPGEPSADYNLRLLRA